MEYGCIGTPLKHSFSALIHPYFGSYKYELCELAEDALEIFFKEKKFKAINVTIPYKREVMKYLDFIDPLALKIGAVNTIVNENGSLRGFNTDFYGMTALIHKAGIEISGKKVLILGSGGTSHTAHAVAEDMGAEEILVVSRGGGDISYEQMYEDHTDAQIIINTTPLGMYPNLDGCPVKIDAFSELSGVIDAVYNPLCTRLVRSAQKRGIKVEGGLYMLIAQAAKASELFLGSVNLDAIGRAYNEMRQAKQNIVLIGMPSSGKSTVGRALAKNLSKNFYDIDALTEERIGMSIAEFFEKQGEAAFRKIESEIIAEISAVSGAVIATGGGAVLNEKNTELLSLNGRIYFLDRPIDCLISTPDRPLSSSREQLKRRYAERYEIYRSSCDVIIDAVGTVEENALKIKEDFLK